METQELCSMDIAEVCHYQLYEMIFAALLAPEMSYLYLYCFSHFGNLWSQTPGVVTVNFARCWWTCISGQWVQTAYRYVVVDCRETTYCRSYLLTSLLTICFVVYL